MNHYFEHNYTITILEKHLDSFGHMNNAQYLALFEEARWDFITHRGYGYKVVHEKKVGPVILEVNLRFQKELHLRNKITIKSKLEWHKAKLAQLKQVMLADDGSEHATALFTFGLFDMKSRKLITPTPEWLFAIGATNG